MDKAKETVLSTHMRVAGMLWEIALLPSSGSDLWTQQTVCPPEESVMPLPIERGFQAETPEVFWGTQESLWEASQCWHLAWGLTCNRPPLKTLHKGQRYCWLAEWLGSHDCSVFKFKWPLSLEDLPFLHLGGVGYNYQYAKYCKESLNYTARVKLLTVKETKL